eukprot:TRINITY_DN1869_c6_g1_i1.p1 TRINITY_DN1869_c6_g1~~TRINITY_DN1869_c6_g1_i1.p1  ORF type:complete len:447 (+),score=52.69 TRINITY_DN1869_c6_g1_i1:87-1427(+)
MGLAGMNHGSFFKAPEWVDLGKPPGHTSQLPVIGKQPWNFPTNFIFGGHLVWAIIAMIVYVFFPYDLEGAAAMDPNWLKDRIILNVVMIYIYYGFWHIVAYHRSSRKFNPTNQPNLATLLQNVWYTTLGGIQWSFWEFGYCTMLAKGYLPYHSDADVLASWKLLALNFLYTAATASWREIHFYFAHRFIHYRAVYKYIHSLHHRNPDIEPFSGMCMHPLEHLYYFSCIGPQLYFTMSPYCFLFNGIHLTLSPAAGHSGYEDHWAGDQFHYLHHAKFECNYGGPTFILDKVFGTFRDKIGETSVYEGEWSNSAEFESKSVGKYLQADGDLLNFYPTKVDHILYWVYTIFLFYSVYLEAIGEGIMGGVYGCALNVAFGPPIVGLVLMTIFGDPQSYLWPFQKEKLFGAAGFHLVAGFFFVLLPTFHIVLGSLGSGKETSGYYQLWNLF